MELVLLSSQSKCAMSAGLRITNLSMTKLATRRVSRARAHLAANCTNQDPRESVDSRTFGTWPVSSGANQDLQRGVGGAPIACEDILASVKGSVKFRQCRLTDAVGEPVWDLFGFFL